MARAVSSRQTYSTATSLQNRISNTLKQTRCRGSSILSGSRLFALPIWHTFCTQTNVQARAPSPKGASEPTRIQLGSRGSTDDRDKALRQEAITYANSLKSTKGQLGFLNEKNKLGFKRHLGFCGNVYIPPKYSATDRAATVVEESTDPSHLIFFVDGSLITRMDSESASVVTCFGAAVVYKPLEPNQPWAERYFAPPKCEGGSDRIEVIAILNGLKIAAVETDLFRRCDLGDSDDAAAKLKVTILSDCTSALYLLLKLQSRNVAKPPLLDDPVIRELIAVSQYLHRNEVRLELRWVPGHSRIAGNTFANGAAQYAVRQPEIGAILEERLRVQVVEASSGPAESPDPQKSTPPKNGPQEGQR